MWKPGQSGNPAGRPPQGETLTGALRERADKKALADKLIEMALGGNVGALKYIYDRIDGQPKQHIEMSNERDGEWLELFKGVKREAEGDPTGD